MTTIELTPGELWRIQSALSKEHRKHLAAAERWQKAGREDRAEIAMSLAAEADQLAVKLRRAAMDRPTDA